MVFSAAFSILNVLSEYLRKNCSLRLNHAGQQLNNFNLKSAASESYIHLGFCLFARFSRLNPGISQTEVMKTQLCKVASEALCGA